MTTDQESKYSVNKLILLDCCDCYTRRACVILSAHREREGRQKRRIELPRYGYM